MNILDKIHTSNDIKKLDPSELEPLCAEIRDEIISSVSKNGGHLASGLGAVELTVALHRVYDTSKDRLIFDVGHQCYPHKIITGRRAGFSELRQSGGISGFPRPYESDDDAFIAGHASNSVSVALGMARARTLTEADYDVAAVIGDGALTGGLAYEGLCNAARSGEPLVVVLNDNNMSIADNVGGTARMLEEMRVRPAYIRFKKWYRAIFKNLPRLYSFNHGIKEWLKKWLLSSNLFSEMGFYYLGPVDGHDLKRLETVISWAKELKMPVLVHVLTQKGKGCEFAEQDPELYHGVAPFDMITGKVSASGECFSNVFGRALCDIAEKDNRIVAITAAMSAGTGLKAFAERFPKRAFDVGIAEEHAVSMASGMAKQGLIPVVAVYSSFLQRAYDQIIHDAALQNLHVVFCVDRAGIVGHDGETHNGVFDMAFLSTVPGMTVLCPADFAELREMLKYAVYEAEGPVAIRYPRGGEGYYKECRVEHETILRHGEELTVACCGLLTGEAMRACDELEKLGIGAELIKIGIALPNSFEKTLESIKKTGAFFMAEELCEEDCLGKRILSAAAEKGISPASVKLVNLGEGIVPHGSVNELWEKYGLTAHRIAEAAAEQLRKGRGEG